MKQRWIAGLGIAVLLIGAVPVTASTFLHMTRQELVAQADAVVQGIVLEVHSFWNERGTLILTEATVMVEDSWMGRARSAVVLRTVGGEVGDYRVEAHGFPTFEKGQRLVVFLQDRPDGTAEVLGYQQGLFRVENDPRGRAVAMPAVDGGARLIRPDGRPGPQPEAIALETLRGQIRETAGRLGRLSN